MSKSKGISSKKAEGAAKDFEPVLQANDRHRYLGQCARDSSPTLIWTENQVHVLNSHLDSLNITDGIMTCWAPSDTDVFALKKYLQSQNEPACLFKITCEQQSFFFKAIHRTFSRAGLEFEIPEELYRVQRRKNIRFKFRSGYTLKMTYDDPLTPGKKITRPIYDMSSGGVSFLTEEVDLPLFPVGMQINNIHFRLNSEPVLANGEVRHTKLLADNLQRSAVKVGVQFTQISSENERRVGLYVLEESRKFLTFV